MIGKTNMYDHVWKWLVEVIINFFTYNPDIFLVIMISVFEGSKLTYNKIDIDG